MSIECNAGTNKPQKNTQKNYIYIYIYIYILKGRCILIPIKTILFNFFSSNNFTNTKKDFYLWSNCLGIYPIAIMNILNECAIYDNIIIMGYSVCVTICRLYLSKHNCFFLPVFFLCVFFWCFFHASPVFNSLVVEQYIQFTPRVVCPFEGYTTYDVISEKQVVHKRRPSCDAHN